MPPREVCWRLRRLCWQVRARLMHGWWHARFLGHRSEHARALESLDSVSFYGLAGIGPADVPAGWKGSAVEAADSLLRHRFRYLALGEIDLGETIRWNHEYKRGIDTPLVFGPWMDYRDSEAYGDFKYFWEVPRLQHLILLAKAYYLTDEPKYADEILRQLRQFREQAPYLLGVNWTVPMESGIRLISLCWITMFLRRYLGEHPEGLDLIESMVRANLHYCIHNYARYSSANNHLVGEAAGVFVAGICFGHLKGMRRHRDRAFEILSREIHRQHHADGVNKEQAVHYQLFALSFFLLAGLLGKANGMDFPSAYWTTLEKSVEFIAALMGPRHHLPHIGDSDDGRAVVLSALSADDAATIVATSAALFKRGDFKQKAGPFDEASLWLFGKSAKDEFDQMTSEPSVGGLRRFYPDGGYYILEGGPRSEVQLIFDCGPLGFGSIAAHGHADALSFVLTVRGLPFLIDPGTYTYDRRDPFRDYFRSTAAHNTITVDNMNQSVAVGPFLWSRKADAHVGECVADADSSRVSGWHGGYTRLTDPVVHWRTVDMERASGELRICDELTGRGSHEVRIFFHLAPDCEVATKGNHFHVEKADNAIVLIADSAMTCEVIRGRNDPPTGWFSSAYDERVPTNTIVCTGTFRGKNRFRTQIHIGK